jgi:hypothetical protein
VQRGYALPEIRRILSWVHWHAAQAEEIVTWIIQSRLRSGRSLETGGPHCLHGIQADVPLGSIGIAEVANRRAQFFLNPPFRSGYFVCQLSGGGQTRKERVRARVRAKLYTGLGHFPDLAPLERFVSARRIGRQDDV